MTTKGKISKAKRNNQKHNKLVKKGLVKKAKKRGQIPAAKEKVLQHAAPQYDTEESDPEDMLDMVDEDDVAFLKQAVANQSYGLLSKVRIKRKETHRQKQADDNDLEENYENQTVPGAKVKSLLPIKTKSGIVNRVTAADDDESVHESHDEENDETNANEDEDDNSDDEENYELAEDSKVPLTEAELLASRQETLRARKLHIGTLSSGLLENPEEKVTNFKTLLNLMDEETPIVYLTVRKLAMASLLEVFKDLLPSYQIKHHETGDVKLKKDTLKLQKYETQLLVYYKKYLQKLEKQSKVFARGSGASKEDLQLGELAIGCMCQLLMSHSHFNYALNVIQTVLPFLNKGTPPVRRLVLDCCKTVFKEDKRGDTALLIVRTLNKCLKNSSRVRTEPLQALLHLRISNVNLDEEKEQEMKERKLQAHKSRVLQLSKKERKRKKRLAELEKELLETRAEESKESKQKNLTEITKMVFGIYFRVLKNAVAGEGDATLVGCCLEGLAKFAQCINLELYSDLVNVLAALLRNGDDLGYVDQLRCVQTVLAMLSGQGEALNVDPSRFYALLYERLLGTRAGNQSVVGLVLLETLTRALLLRRKRVSPRRQAAFAKRIGTLALQLLHNGALSCLGLLRAITVQNRAAAALLEPDAAAGDGRFMPEAADPEHANASCSSLFELTALRKHYHPVVRKLATMLASGNAPPPELTVDSRQLFERYDPADVRFEPAVPVPRAVRTSKRRRPFRIADAELRRECVHAKRLKKSSLFPTSK